MRPSLRRGEIESQGGLPAPRIMSIGAVIVVAIAFAALFLWWMI
jgi:hypothetical protein